MSRGGLLNTQHAQPCSLLPPPQLSFSEVPGGSLSQGSWSGLREGSSSLQRAGVFSPSIHLGLEAQACVGVLCHLGEAGAPTGEVDGRCFLASCLHTVMSGRCSPDRERVSPPQTCPHQMSWWWPITPRPQGQACNPLQNGRLSMVQIMRV